MAERVEVVVQAIDRATDVLKKVQGGVSNLQMSFTQVNAAFALADRAIKTVENAFQDTVGAVINYNKAIMDSAMAVGISTDEMSRLVQVADDAGIAQEQLTSALALATKNGFAPSIESIADLADRTNAMTSPTARAAELAKILGRNWSSLVPLLSQGGDAIRALAGEIDDGLVVTEEEVKATEEARLAIDEWNDRVQAAKLSAGQFLVEGLMPIVEGFESVGSALDEQEARLFQQADTYEEYTRLWNEQSLAMKLFGDVMREDEFATQKLADAQEILAIKSEEMAGGMPGVVDAYGTIPPAVEEAIVATEGMSSAQLIALAVEAQIAGNTALAQHYFALARAAREGELRIEDLTEAMIRSLEFGEKMKALGLQNLVGVENVSSTGRAGGEEEGFQGGGSFMVPGSGGGDRPYIIRLEPGERVNVTPRNQTFNFHNNISRDVDGDSLIARMQEAARRL